MNQEQIIRAWKDNNYRSSLSEEELALMPASPAGMVLTDEELESVIGQIALSFFGCTTNNYDIHDNGIAIVSSKDFVVKQYNLSFY